MDNELFFFQKGILKKKKEIENLVDETKAANRLLREDINILMESIEDIDIEPDILNIPKFKGQIVFEKYLQIIDQKSKKIKEKKKIRGIIEKNEIINMQKDINNLKQMIKK